MASKANFQKSLMTSEFDGSKLTTGKFYDADDALAECLDGAFVTLGDLEDSEVYANLKDPNVYKITAPAAATDKVAVVDYVGVPYGTIGGVTYREGTKLYGLTAPAGTKVRVRKLGVGDTFYLSTGNFTGAVGSNGFAVVTAGDVRLTPAAAAATDKTCIKIHYEQNVVEGMVNSDTQYFCEIINLV